MKVLGTTPLSPQRGSMDALLLFPGELFFESQLQSFHTQCLRAPFKHTEAPHPLGQLIPTRESD